MSPIRSPTRVLTQAGPPLTNVMQLALGDVHTCVLQADGTVQCWGHNTDGELGDETTNLRPYPAPVHLTCP